MAILPILLKQNFVQPGLCDDVVLGGQRQRKEIPWIHGRLD
jgi:hypothetical protein